MTSKTSSTANRCDDALISVVDGRLQLDFDREASSFGAAVGSAVDDIERAGGRVVKIDPLPPAGEDSHRMRG